MMFFTFATTSFATTSFLDLLNHLQKIKLKVYFLVEYMRKNNRRKKTCKYSFSYPFLFSV